MILETTENVLNATSDLGRSIKIDPSALSEGIRKHTLTKKIESALIGEDGNEILHRHVQGQVKLIKLVDCLELAALTTSVFKQVDINGWKERADFRSLSAMKRRTENISAILLPCVRTLVRHVNAEHSDEERMEQLQATADIKSQIQSILKDSTRFSFCLDFAVRNNEEKIEIFVPNSEHLPAHFSTAISCEARLIASMQRPLEDAFNCPVIVNEAFVSDPLINDLMQYATLSEGNSIGSILSAGHVISEYFNPDFKALRATPLSLVESNKIEESYKSSTPYDDVLQAYKTAGEAHVEALQAYNDSIQPIIQKIQSAVPFTYTEITDLTRLVDDAILEKVFDKAQMMNDLVAFYDVDEDEAIRMSCSRLLVTSHLSAASVGAMFAPINYLKQSNYNL